MGITTFSFWIFLIPTVLVYYTFPAKQYQWIVLLTANYIFFLLVSSWTMIPYLLWGIIIAWGGGLLVSVLKQEKARKYALIATILLLVIELAYLKYSRLGIRIYNAVASMWGGQYSFETAGILAPIGISYYTLSVIGYVIEVYWGNISAEKNLLKFSVFVTFFPQMTSGPITRYGEMRNELFCEHHFDHKKVLFGIQRILWGLFKKLVIADRVATFVTNVYADYYTYSGTWIFVAVVLFALQLYTDFSGCMDIICGASECFGISLPENFNSPFLSETVSEFWGRWHITMGAWFKDFLLYPLMKSSGIQSLRKRLKKHFGKGIAKSVPTYLCMSVVWITIGVWHGGDFKYIFASGILQGFYLIMGEMLSPLSRKVNGYINTEAFSWHLFRRLRTAFLLCTSWVFIRAERFLDGIKVIQAMFAEKNGYILLNDDLYTLGLSWKDFNVVYCGVLLLILVAHQKEKGIDPREELYAQNIWAQWLVMLVMLFTIIIFGIYGPGYNPVDFIYKNF